MLTELFFLLLSLAVLVWSADKMVAYSVELAVAVGVSSLVVGLTIVALGTSLPELASSIVAVVEQHGEIALGNAIGSNICNLGLIFGVSAAFASVTLVASESRRLSFWLLGSSLVFGGMIYSLGTIGVGSGVVMTLLLVAYLVSITRRVSLQPQVIRNLVNKVDDSGSSQISQLKSAASARTALFVKLALCLVLLVLSSELMVNSIVALAGAIGVSEEVIALSLVAFGTSLPELSVSVAAAKRKESDILVGNVVGSNVANLFMVIGISSMVGPLSASPDLLRIDIPVMLLFTILFVFFLGSKIGVTRGKGVAFCLLYLGYLFRFII